MVRKLMVAALVIAAAVFPAGAQNGGPAANARYALVVGNGNYRELGRLKNPAADARDVAAALEKLAFTVETLIDADLPAMEDAVVRLGNRLSTAKDAAGFFFFAGHGVQSGGVNYLVPADARIPTETYLRTKALSAQSVLDTMQEAGNRLNVVVLDACRDNPFSWARSGTRGLSVAGVQPPGSIVVYATSAGKAALDGTGRNGVFTGELLKHLGEPGLEVKEIFNRTGAAVQSATGGLQVPAVYSQFFGTAYFARGAGGSPAADSPAAADAAAGARISKKALEAYRRGMENLRAGGLQSLNKGEVSDSLMKLLQPAAGEGHAPAALWLGLLHYGREFGSEDKTESVRRLRLAAEKLPELRRIAEAGDRDTALGLALFHMGEGLAEAGLPANREEGLSWCRRAAEAGHPTARIIMGSLHEEGRVVERSAAEAATWYRGAAEQGDTEAMALLAAVYRSGGPGLEADAGEALKWLLRAAEKGSTSAMSALGDLCAEGGPGLPKNAAEAARWYRAAMDKGETFAAYGLARVYIDGGPGFTADAKKAADLYRLLADKGETAALAPLAELYASGGPGLPADAKKAAAVYKEAADKGDEFALGELLRLYREGGPGLPPDARKAVEMYRRKADAGNLNAMLELGNLYLDGGASLPKDGREALKWYARAADLGSADAMWTVGMMHIGGNGVAKDPAKGTAWLVKAAESGGGDGARYAYLLALEYYHGGDLPQNHDEALKWYRRAAEAGDENARSQLGWMFYAGEGTAPDYAEAARWWRLAADQGSPGAQYSLGLLYLNGEGVRQDYVSAHLWLNLAASRYDPGESRDQAARVRDDTAVKMTPSQLAEAQKLARDWEEKHR